MNLLVLDKNGNQEQLPIVNHKQVIRAKNNANLIDPTALKVVGEKAFVLLRDRVFRIAVDLVSPPSSDAAAPLKIIPIQEPLVVKGARPTLKTSATGGSMPYDFELVVPIEGLEIDAKTGVIRLDVGEMSAHLRQVFRQALRKSTPAEAIKSAKEESNDLAEWTKERFGRKISGVPVSVPIQVRVFDADGNDARVWYYVILDLSTQQFAAIYKQAVN